MPRTSVRLIAVAGAFVVATTQVPAATPQPLDAVSVPGARDSDARRTLGTGRSVSVPGARHGDARRTPGAGRPGWMTRIDRLVRRRSVGISLRLDRRILYERAALTRRIPASNQKLLLSMASLARFDSASRLPTIAAARGRKKSVVTGNLWILGTGDPSVGTKAAYRRSLPFGMTPLRVLARRVADSGIERIRGRVIGSTGYFSRDWWAPGWKADFPTYHVALPSALTFNGNLAGGRHISDPERRAAAWFTRKLEDLGVRVRRHPAAARAPRGLSAIASINSKPLVELMRFMNVRSSNTVAELLGKRLGANRFGRPGTIAKGARALRAWARGRGIKVESFDSSGLSYRNRISVRGMARLVDLAEEKQWGPVLRRTLPTPGQGTLEGRLRGIPVRAKTGTLDRASTLSGWVWLRRVKQWASFSIMSSRLPKWKAVDIENKVVRVIHERAR